MWLIITSGWHQEQQTSPNSLYAFCFEIPLSVCLSPPPSPPTHAHVLPGKYPHPLHCHHGDTWPVTSLCCSSVLVSFFFFFFFFNLTLSLCFVWLIMSGSSNSVSISNVVLIYIYFISLMFHSVFVFLVVFGLFIFLQVNFLLI